MFQFGHIWSQSTCYSTVKYFYILSSSQAKTELFIIVFHRENMGKLSLSSLVATNAYNYEK